MSREDYLKVVEHAVNSAEAVIRFENIYVGEIKVQNVSTRTGIDAINIMLMSLSCTVEGMNEYVELEVVDNNVEKHIKRWDYEDIY